MRKVSVELDWETVDTIVYEQMKDALEYLRFALEQRNQDLDVFPIFSENKDEDVAELKKHIDAAKLMIKWFKGHE